MLRFLLELTGHEVHEASDGPGGLEALSRLRPDVALVDVGLPGSTAMSSPGERARPVIRRGSSRSPGTACRKTTAGRARPDSTRTW
jgi:CheY-like chemotaxis protein